MDSTRSGQVLALRTFSTLSDNPQVSATNGSVRSLNTADPSDARPEEPTRTYQCLLVFAGFMMIFHIIGINSIYGLFQVGRLQYILIGTHHTESLPPQEFYTSPETNIKDAQGQEALVSLVGTMGSGLTWSGCIFVNPLIPRVNVKLITLVGAFIMSLGMILASFCDQVRSSPLAWSFRRRLSSSNALALAIVPDPRTPLRNWVQHVLLPTHVRHSYLLRQEQRCRNGNCRCRRRCRGSRAVPALPRPPDPPWDTLVTSPPGPLELRRQHPYCQRIEEARSNRCYWSIASQHGHRETRHVRTAGMSSAPLCLLCRGAECDPFDKFGQSVGAFLQAAGNMVPNYYLTTYSVSVLSYSSSTGSLLLALNTAANTVARIGMGLLADRVGRQNTMVLSVSPFSLPIASEVPLPRTAGHFFRGVCFRALVRLGPCAVPRIHRLLRRPCGRLQRPFPNDHHRNIRYSKLREREQCHLLYPRYRRALRCPDRWRHIGKSPVPGLRRQLRPTEQPDVRLGGPEDEVQQRSRLRWSPPSSRWLLCGVRSLVGRSRQGRVVVACLTSGPEVLRHHVMLT